MTAAPFVVTIRVDWFPYEPRLHQPGFVDLVRDIVRAEAHAVVESGTGTGKTVCALSGALAEALPRGKRVLYLTRTNAQQRQVALEFRRIRERSGQPIAMVALQGRTHLCPLRETDPELAAATSEELALMCRDRRRVVDLEREGKSPPPGIPPCRFYRATEGTRLAQFLDWCRAESPTAEELIEKARGAGLCPYEATKALLPDANVIVAPYVYLFHGGLRRAFLSWANARVEDFVVIVDEAHNLPDFARELASVGLSPAQVARARDEAQRHGNIEIAGTPILQFLGDLDAILTRAAEELLVAGEEDALVPPDWLETELLSALRTTSVGIAKAVATMEEYGEAVREKKRHEGRIPRSYVASVAAFLQAHLEADEGHARLVTRVARKSGTQAPGTREAREAREARRSQSLASFGPPIGAPDAQDPQGRANREEIARGEARLECYAIDPAPILHVLLKATASLHMSGTLRPLDAYRDSVGLPGNTPLKLVPSALPPEHRLLLIHPETTTRYDEVRRRPEMWDILGKEVAAIRSATPRNLMVFAPSHETAQRLAKFLPSALIEDATLAQADLMALVGSFKGQRGGTFIAVLGGRVAEGLDFPDEELEVAVIVGLPFPRPSARQRAMERFYDRRTGGRGFEVASRGPMLRRLLQAAGRVVRSPTDRGVVVILDKRAVLFADDLGDVRVSRHPASELEAFFADPALPTRDSVWVRRAHDGSDRVEPDPFDRP
ncbi:MAG: ATP-dependent DNA helicase [Thermoplasmatota archaeon]